MLFKSKNGQQRYAGLFRSGLHQPSKTAHRPIGSNKIPPF